MPNRVKLHIDEISHFNDVTFKVYRDTDSDVSESDIHVMDVEEVTSLRVLNRMDIEQLTRDPDTPYVFYTSRRFKTSPFPEVYIGDKRIENRDLILFPEEKMIEIHNGQLGLGDNQLIYASYDYETINVVDDYRLETGKSYYGPPATGLRIPRTVTLLHNTELNRLEIRYELDDRGIVYFYRIKAWDREKNSSPLSLTKFIELHTDEYVFIRIERSPDGEEWEEVGYSNMLSWLTDVVATTNPKGVTNAKVTPLNSKEAKLQFDNPWKSYLDDPRDPYMYRIRTEDGDGQASPWYIFTVEGSVLYIKPKEILIRRKVDNGRLSSETDIDAIDVFRLKMEHLDPYAERIELIDDQLTDATKYGYTFFYTDILGMKGMPAYVVSDHRMWSNLLLFRGQFKYDKPGHKDFITTFEMADRVIEIGID